MRLCLRVIIGCSFHHFFSSSSGSLGSWLRQQGSSTSLSMLSPTTNQRESRRRSSALDLQQLLDGPLAVFSLHREDLARQGHGRPSGTSDRAGVIFASIVLPFAGFTSGTSRWQTRRSVSSRSADTPGGIQGLRLGSGDVQLAISRAQLLVTAHQVESTTTPDLGDHRRM